mmetsp:Transcript_28377/g.30542  ORF Transcript_28377/g.30542 Transcript_28377/m.30542 type:complete len:82 (+) Transcript_28377:526-771(+)
MMGMLRLELSLSLLALATVLVHVVIAIIVVTDDDSDGDGDDVTAVVGDSGDLIKDREFGVDVVVATAAEEAVAVPRNNNDD